MPVDYTLIWSFWCTAHCDYGPPSHVFFINKKSKIVGGQHILNWMGLQFYGFSAKILTWNMAMHFSIHSVINYSY